jgi:glycine betaine/choline ABC-type transport system substrate-binding protein
MTHISGKIMTLIVVLGLAITSLAAVPGAAAQDDKPTIRVGSKDFTESILLAEMVSLMLEDHGYTVERKINLGGTAVVHQALVNDEVDIYVEYTGTGLLAILGMEMPETDGGDATPASDGAVGQDPVYDIVKQEYAEQFGITWLEPWGFNNTYAIAVTRDTAEEYDLESISDLEGVSGDMTLGATQEFLVRPDGLPGFSELYGIEFGDEQGLDPGLVYAALENGDVDVVTATATDGRIKALDLVVLKDDKHFFPPYYAAPVVDSELLEQNPEIADILNELSGQIDDDTMADLNFQVDDGGVEPIEVARAFLEERGLIGGE